MNQDAKRDIYDLIAELAKSSNLNLDGTEQTDESIIPVRKPSFQDAFSSESVQKNHPSEQIHSATNALTPASESNQSNDHSEEQKIGLDELERLKNAALEELKLAHTALLADLKHQVQHKVVSASNATISNKTDDNYPDNIIVVPHESNASTTNDAVSGLPSAHLNQSAPDKNMLQHSITNPPLLHEQIGHHEGDEAISVDELNRVTSPVEESELTTENPDPAAEATQKIQEQLSVLSDKIDALKDKNFHLDLIREIKQSDERLMQQVNKSHESMLRLFIQRFSQIQTNTGDHVIKWIGIINLIVLLIALIVLLFQRLPINNHVQQLPQKAVLPSVKPKTPIQPSKPQPVKQERVPINEAIASTVSDATVNDTSKPLQQPENPGNQKAIKIKSPARSNTTNMPKKDIVEIQSIAVEEKKANIQNKRAANDEVYFGED